MTTVPFVDLHVQDSIARQTIKDKISTLIDEAAYIGGEPVQSFTKSFAEYTHSFCVTVANGTDALFLALRAVGVGAGDEVITVPFTFIATAEAISVVGAQVKFVDIHPKTYTMDPALIEKAITPKTKAILPVHLFGQPADMDSINQIAKKHGLKVIEDAAQAHGSEYKGRPVGSLGDMACFSFYPTKNLGGFGDGGAVTSIHEKYVKAVAQMADHGRVDRYLHQVVGLNSRMDAFQAAVLSIKLKELNLKNERRRKIAEAYNRVLSQSPYINPPYIETYSKHVFHLYCVETSYQDQLLQYLKNKNIGCGVYYPVPIHLQPAYAFLGHQRGDFPVSERASTRILALPMFPEMTDQQIETVCQAVRDFSPRK